MTQQEGIMRTPCLRCLFMFPKIVTDLDGRKLLQLLRLVISSFSKQTYLTLSACSLHLQSHAQFVPVLHLQTRVAACSLGLAACSLGLLCVQFQAAYVDCAIAGCLCTIRTQVA